MGYWEHLYPEDFERAFGATGLIFTGAKMVYDHGYALDLAAEVRDQFRIRCRCIFVAQTMNRDKCWVLFLPAERDLNYSKTVNDRDEKAIDLARRWLRTMPDTVENYQGHLPEPQKG